MTCEATHRSSAFYMSKNVRKTNNENKANSIYEQQNKDIY